MTVIRWRAIQAVFLCVVQAGMALANEQKTGFEVSLPEFLIKLFIVDEDVDLGAFGNQLTATVESHLNSSLPSTIAPSSEVQMDAFNTISVEGVIKRTLLGKQNGIPLSLIESTFQGEGRVFI